ncbi:MAG: DUF7144 family membrane protein [Stackebrandtia sp.]
MSTRKAMAATGAILAAVLMIVLGCWQVVAGLAALAGDPLFTVPASYFAGFNLSAWGWVHLAEGALVLVAGLFVFTGRLWARVVGIVVTVSATLLNFAFIPYYPFWAIASMALGVAVIWALAQWEPGDLTAAPPTSTT